MLMKKNRTKGSIARHRLSSEVLEGRRMLASSTFVNDTWVDLNGGTLEVGDMVSATGDASDIEFEFGSEAFTSINAAIDAVDAGGTVTVLAGTYVEDVEVDKPVTIEGANAGVSVGVDAETRVDESIIDGVVTVNADNVTIDGFTILGGEVAGVTGDVGIFLAAGASETTIENNVIVGSGDGRGILSTFNGENDNLLIVDNDISGFTTGIFNQSNTGVEISGNVIADNTAGVANDFVMGVEITGNDFNDNAEAVGVFMSEDVVVSQNNLDSNEIGIANYGGAEVDAAFNYWGTADLDEIADLVTGDVAFEPVLQSEITGEMLLTFSGGGTSLVVNGETGEFTFVDADGEVYSGEGARIQNGKVKIHEHVGKTKLDIKGTVGGDLEAVVKPQGKAKKISFDLTAGGSTMMPSLM